jgi:hypothetical protein
VKPATTMAMTILSLDQMEDSGEEDESADMANGDIHPSTALKRTQPIRRFACPTALLFSGLG